MSFSRRSRRIPYAETPAGQREAEGRAKAARYHELVARRTAGMASVSGEAVRDRGVTLPDRRRWRLLGSLVDVHTGEPREHFYLVPGVGYAAHYGLGVHYYLDAKRLRLFAALTARRRASQHRKAAR